MKLKRIDIILRKDGLFWAKSKQIPAVHKGDGYGVFIFLEPSQIDEDFGEYVLAITQRDYERIGKMLEESDHKTHDLLGRGWDGPKPYYELQDFM